MVDQGSPRLYVAKFYGRLWLIPSAWEHKHFLVVNLSRIIILWVYYTIPFGFKSREGASFSSDVVYLLDFVPKLCNIERSQHLDGQSTDTSGGSVVTLVIQVTCLLGMFIQDGWSGSKGLDRQLV